MRFNLISNHTPSGDQPKAINELSSNIIDKKIKSQVLLGATGTGKTFTIANVINKVQKKTLILAHNKTLAAQLYSEIKQLFPNNKVEFFISYFDYYQPEAYLPSKDMYIEKSSMSNAEIEKMRVSTLNSLAFNDDVIVVASVAAIYPSISRQDFLNATLNIHIGQKINLKDFKQHLVMLNYTNNNVDVTCGTFRFKGDVCEIGLGYTDEFILKILFFDNEIEKILKIDPITHQHIETLDSFNIVSSNEYVVNSVNLDDAINLIKNDTIERSKWFTTNNKLIEAQRIQQRIDYDIEAIKEFGYCSGIENYARYLENRKPGSTPYTILDFFNPEEWLLVVDESHITVPQIRGMYNTDRSRKETLVEYGFRLPSALDNRPLNFEEFLSKMQYSIFVSATPNEWEIDYSNNSVVQQIVRPTGLLDPTIEIRPIKHQIDDIISQINNNIAKNERVFVNVMTIRMAEELTKYLLDKKIKCAYLHNELKTLQRSKIINDLRKGVFDVVIGINLLKEGLDVPEVSLVLILDADKSGFFRSDKSLIQIIGRAARNQNGKVIMYADIITDAMEKAILETERRRNIQMEYNKINNIIPKTISKPISIDIGGYDYSDIQKTKSPQQLINELKKQMLAAAKKQDYEEAAKLRDAILEISVNLKS